MPFFFLIYLYTAIYFLSHPLDLSSKFKPQQPPSLLSLRAPGGGGREINSYSHFPDSHGEEKKKKEMTPQAV